MLLPMLQLSSEILLSLSRFCPITMKKDRLIYESQSISGSTLNNLQLLSVRLNRNKYPSEDLNLEEI
jgi:hypothetical protein